MTHAFFTLFLVLKYVWEKIKWCKIKINKRVVILSRLIQCYLNDNINKTLIF
jgi:hypothetical protein